MQAISVRQPWAFAIARGGKTVYNHALPTAYRGPLLIHASMRVDLASCDSPLIRSAGWDPSDPLATLGAVIALAELTDVCTAAVHGERCDCGPWAEPQRYHWRLADVRPLPRPIVALGRVDPWIPPPSLVSEVHAMLATAAKPATLDAGR
ncbi:hypothetical protein [Thermomonospora curvata]|uniref:ASCH domain-containing protein n=1 Tax=Thermomonospora curvata (strain ATCC 19995 / DSM 43183 / JCM 3096 / KCTC 9072 / NBRC 15933 / NCIMB 10081 / Henssen B9) TaxID=471852 RepID=D1AC61_THECD|nr:hypothetical protein [Thermomonospora curvata]ACY97327.1 hypothetical protein Tcur_1753 [Thermomonospora curvata DSM 43183]